MHYDQQCKVHVESLLLGNLHKEENNDREQISHFDSPIVQNYESR